MQILSPRAKLSLLQSTQDIEVFANRYSPVKLNEDQLNCLKQINKFSTSVQGKRQCGKTLLLSIYAAHSAVWKVNQNIAIFSVNRQIQEHVRKSVAEIINKIDEEFNLDLIKRNNVDCIQANSKILFYTNADRTRGMTLNELIFDDINNEETFINTGHYQAKRISFAEQHIDSNVFELKILLA